MVLHYHAITDRVCSVGETNSRGLGAAASPRHVLRSLLAFQFRSVPFRFDSGSGYYNLPTDRVCSVGETNSRGLGAAASPRHVLRSLLAFQFRSVPFRFDSGSGYYNLPNAHVVYLILLPIVSRCCSSSLLSRFYWVILWMTCCITLPFLLPSFMVVNTKLSSSGCVSFLLSLSFTRFSLWLLFLFLA